MKPVVLFILLLPAAVCSQEPRFQTRAHEVLVPVAVTTKGGKPVESLPASAFLVLNDGKLQVVRLVEQDSYALPIHAVLVVQANDGSEAALAKIRKTAAVFSSYITNDMGTGRPSLAAVVTVSDDVAVRQEFTGDPNLLDDAFARMKATGDSGRLLDGVNLACDMLAARREAARRVIVLISESRDRNSKVHFEDVAAKAQKNEITVFTLSYSAYATAFTQKAGERPVPDQPGLYDPQGQGGANLLAIGMELARLAKINIAEALAQSTGGSHEKFTTLRGLETGLTEVGLEIHNRYVLTFVPPSSQPLGYHRLSVSLRSPAGPFKVHSRAGYWTTAPE